jgi:putative lipoprotein
MSLAFRLAAIIIFVMITGPDLGAQDKKIDNWFSSDKYKHFAVSAFLSSGSSIVVEKHFEIRERTSLIIGFGVTISLGGAKEIVDKHSRQGTASLKDLIWDIAGALTGTLAAGMLL